MNMIRSRVSTSRTSRRAVAKSTIALLVTAMLVLVLTSGFAVRTARADSATLVPSQDLGTEPGWETDDGLPCGNGGGTVCSSRIDEDIDAPDDSDFIRSPAGVSGIDVVFELSDPPGPGIVTQITARFRAYVEGSGSGSALVMAVRQGLAGTFGPQITTPITTTPTEYSVTFSGLNLLPEEIQGALGWVRGNGGADTRVVITAVNYEIEFIPVASNPQLPPTCGLDIALVIDSSGSIVGPELDTQKDAFKQFVDAFLPSSPSELAVVDFDAFASVVQGFTNDPVALKNAIDSATTGQFTNWDDALHDARMLFPNRAEPDAIIFASDGWPNSIGGHEGEPLELYTPGAGLGLNRAMLEANAAKAAGIRIFSLGVGQDIQSESNLGLISSPDAVYLTDFDDLAATLAGLARELCDRGQIDVVKFYDANANGINDDGQDISGWPVSVQGPVNLSGTTPTSFTLGAGQYTVSEATPLQGNWLATTPTSVPVAMPADDGRTIEFGNLCLGGGGGKTIGFWGNKNGKKTMEDNGSLNPELLLLRNLNLRKGDGGNFDPTTYAQFERWLQSADATNMAYMLSAQLSAMALNIEAGGVSSSALVYAPQLLPFGVPGLNSLGFIAIGDLVTAADLELFAHGLTTSGNASRAYQEALQDAIDDANNNLTFVQADPCTASFLSPE